jgi:hypothetical protein
VLEKRKKKKKGGKMRKKGGGRNGRENTIKEDKGAAGSNPFSYG